MLPSEVDHRSIAQRLDLLHFRDEAPGMVFWHPRGLALYRLLEAAVREQARAQGYREVRTPQILRRPVWEASGHWEHFAGGMFKIAGDGEEAAVKPVSCPGHLYIAGRRSPSYRELPLRLSELGVIHRDEPGGTLHGLLRLRQFTQDDGHIFCEPHDAEAELLAFCEAVPAFYRAFGFSEITLALSTRPAERAGDDAGWDHAEAALESVVQKLGGAFTRQPGQGAFYGPKLEWAVRDRQGRPWQCGTIQFDLVMPKRFDLRYVDAQGVRHHPVMLHRAVCGSLERFLGILLEHHAAAPPPWWAPVQIAVVPIGEAQLGAARSLQAALEANDLRVEPFVDETLAKRIALAHALQAPVVAILGPREVAEGAVTLRFRDGQQTLPLAAAVDQLVGRCRVPWASGGSTMLRHN